MHGNLRETDVGSLFRMLSLEQRTGELLIEILTGRFWFVFWEDGRILYATSTEGQGNRLRDYLHGTSLLRALEKATGGSGEALEYNSLWAVVRNGHLPPLDAQNILRHMVAEVLFDVLPLYEGRFAFESQRSLAPRLTAFDPLALCWEVLADLQQWKRLYPVFRNPEQRLIRRTDGALGEDLAALRIDPAWLDGKTSLRRLSRYSQRTLLSLAIALQPLVAAQSVAILSETPSHRPRQNKATVVCVDGSLTVCRTVEYWLGRHGYQVAAVTDPTRALGLVFQVQPQLIVGDGDLSGLDGYQLCAMLRQAAQFAQIPFVISTQQETADTPQRLRTVGATAALRKPFAESDLLAMLDRHLLPTNGGGIRR
ncbi:MAG: response regulator [Oscillatoriales cyanobacterium SM2_1_8]|nr:response regulator [Oscillatoriales cyanobacterium SM2_1_8]